MKTLIWPLLLVLSVLACLTMPVQAAPGNGKKAVKSKKQILIYAQRKNAEIEYVHDGKRYSANEMDYQLGEWHIDATKDSEVVVVLEDNLLLSDVKDVPAMALKAGFTDVRAFVYWKGTGHMAEVLFGPVVKVKKGGEVELEEPVSKNRN